MISFISIGISPVYHNEKAVATISKNLLFGMSILWFNSIKIQGKMKKAACSALEMYAVIDCKSAGAYQKRMAVRGPPADHIQ